MPTAHPAAAFQTNTPAQLTPHPTSPWTEVFQAAAEANQLNSAASQPSSAPASADADHPTRDALSVIFNKA